MFSQNNCIQFLSKIPTFFRSSKYEWTTNNFSRLLGYSVAFSIVAAFQGYPPNSNITELNKKKTVLWKPSRKFYALILIGQNKYYLMGAYGSEASPSKSKRWYGALVDSNGGPFKKGKR